jgi:hypothetical protein
MKRRDTDRLRQRAIGLSRALRLHLVEMVSVALQMDCRQRSTN